MKYQRRWQKLTLWGLGLGTGEFPVQTSHTEFGPGAREMPVHLMGTVMVPLEQGTEPLLLWAPDYVAAPSL